MSAWVYDDGGRADAGYKGKTGDCVTRAVAIATGKPYGEVYDALAEANAQTTFVKRDGTRRAGRRSARNGVWRKVYQRYLEDLGWRWVPTMQIGAGCTVHLRADELPAGRIIARLSRHLCAVVNGVVHDTHDPSREGTRCVYGYFTREAA